MAKLIVKDFSCIKNADLDIKKITLIIGPQASGKSVLSKLTYFFIDLLNSQIDQTLKGVSFEKFSEQVKAKFAEGFPKTAWGDKKFVISFTLGPFRLKITRVQYANTVSDNVRLHFCEDFKKIYTAILSESSRSIKETPAAGMSRYFIDRHNFRMSAEDAINKWLGEHSHTLQLFIPAGRAFFTSFGRAILAFEQGSFLDSTTMRFGQLMSTIGDFGHPFEFISPDKSRFHSQIAKLMGGALREEGGRPIFVAEDGRQIPLSSLSSGQQEILPLLTALLFYEKTWNDKAKGILYIEEPEAHLFPHSQADLTDLLVVFSNLNRSNLKLVITTHSPYVLARINTLIKAGTLGKKYAKRLKKREDIKKIVPSPYWMRPGDYGAYALESGILRNIVDDDGLLDTGYLDSISNEISVQFGELLDVEYE